ncbi:MAG: NUDIX hydrolase [Pseudomonadota bacterium]|nr:NUDIX hydrolase [Pseudomonadota bacterium]
MNTFQAIEILNQAAPDPSTGLPDEIFYYISRTTPLVNVDLLVKDENKCTLLAWRDDKYSGKGWHIPGGIVRFKEKLETRVEKVAKSEIGTKIEFDPTPIALNQLIHNDRDTRGHFISILYNCFLTSNFAPDNGILTPQDAGYLKWHEKCPDNLLGFHEIYRSYIC